MALSLDQVRRIAQLARLRLTPEEESLFAAQLGEVVDYIDQLARFAPASPPAEGAAPEGLPEAADVVVPCLAHEAFLAKAPAAIDGFLLVPDVKGRETAVRPTSERAPKSAPERAPDETAPENHA